MIATTRTAPPATLRAPGTFSFYFPPPRRDVSLIQACAEMADAVVLKGPNGPKTVRAMRRGGWSGTVLFDRAAYEPNSAAVHPTDWFAAQASAGADRLLSPGHWVPWDATHDEIRRAVEEEWRRGQASPGSTLVFAVDVRWLTNRVTSTITALSEIGQPVAVALAHRQDPLGVGGSASGLIALSRNVPGLTILRSDHAAIGAVAFGAAHGSIGLKATYRHFVPQGASGAVIPDDRTPRVFVEQLMDWFTASKIIGWAASQINVHCQRACCQGGSLDRFFDPRYELDAERHNRTCITAIADEILNAPEDQRRRLWGRRCADAVDHYGSTGRFSEVIAPKAQLREWALAVGV
jgi:hypothetical protein